jgi:hypothetical protein
VPAVLQVALSLALLIGAACSRAHYSGERIDLGFNPVASSAYYDLDVRRPRRPEPCIAAR